MDLASVVTTSAFVSGLVALFGGAVLWGKFEQRVENHTQDIEKLNRGLYRKNGTLVYMTEAHFKQEQQACQAMLCDKIGELKEDIKDLTHEISMDRQEKNEQLRRVFLAIGELNGKLKGGERRNDG